MDKWKTKKFYKKYSFYENEKNYILKKMIKSQKNRKSKKININIKKRGAKYMSEIKKYLSKTYKDIQEKKQLMIYGYL